MPELPKRKKKEPPLPPSPDPYVEWERVRVWRLEQLERLKIVGLDAELMAAAQHVDLHLAEDLLRKGCPPNLVRGILL